MERLTNASLMENILKAAKANNGYAEAASIMEYFEPESRNIRELTDYHFDFYAAPQFGGNEGIIVKCWISGHFDQNKPKDKTEEVACGVFKTLYTDLGAMQIMSKLCGTLVFFARFYINTHIAMFEPDPKSVLSETAAELVAANKRPDNIKTDRWTDGWHKDGDLLYRVDNGVFVDGIKIPDEVVYPCVRNYWGGYIRVQELANKKNFEKICWVTEEGKEV